MRIGIICAMQEELDSTISELKLQCNILHNKVFRVFISSYLTHELVFILSGIGKVNAAMHTQYILDKFEIDCIINVGVAGSLSKNCSFGDVVIATDLVQYDMNVTSFGLPLGQVPRMEVFSFPCSKSLLDSAKLICTQVSYNMHFGRIVSGDQFVDSKSMTDHLVKEFNPLACEMEGASIAHVCYVNRVDFIVIRSLSDMAGQDNSIATHSFNELKEMAANRSANVIKNLLEYY